MSDHSERDGNAPHNISGFLDFRPVTGENEEKPPTSDGMGHVNESFVSSHSASNLLRVPSQESMASTETYHSNNSSVVHVRPQGGANAGYEDDDSDEDDADLWYDEKDLAKSMPSHTFQSIRGLPSSNAYKQGMRRTLKLRGHNSRGSVRSQQSVDGAGSSAGVHEDDVINDMPMSLTPAEFAELTQRRKSIKEMPTSIRRKRSLRENVVESAVHRRSHKGISKWRQFKLSVAMGWQHFIDQCKEVLYAMELWRSDLKVIHGMFGSGVQSYFVLLRWLFLLNLVIFLTTIFFLFIPQVIHMNSIQSNNNTFTGWELLTGEGWFVQTELYYRAYTSERIGNDLNYNMPLAYLLVGGGYLLLCLVMLVYSMANSYRNNYIYSGDEFSFFSSKVFCSWDYGVTDKSASLLKHKSVYNELKEMIAEQSYNYEQTLDEKCSLFWLRCLTNIIVIALMSGAGYLIYFSAGLSLTADENDENDVLEKLLLPLVVSGINLIMPMAFRIIASLEKYRSPRTTINVNLARTTMMMLVTVTMVTVMLFIDIQRCRGGKELSSTGRQCDKDIVRCWENYVGYTFYRLVIVDFAFLLLSTFFGEFVRRIVAVNIRSCKETLGPPGFDISRNVIDLVYAQCLCWIGTFYSPLLPLIQLIKFLILFYVKKTSVLMNCRPSMRPFRASKMNLLFLFLLALSFMLAMIVIGYTIMSEDITSPSKLCGPFKGLGSMYQVVTDLVEGFPNWLRQVISYASSASVIAVVFCILGVTVYYYKMLKDSNEKKIKLLKEQIAMAGRDKLYLIKKLQKGITLALDPTTGE